MRPPALSLRDDGSADGGRGAGSCGGYVRVLSGGGEGDV